MSACARPQWSSSVLVLSDILKHYFAPCASPAFGDRSREWGNSHSGVPVGSDSAHTGREGNAAGRQEGVTAPVRVNLCTLGDLPLTGLKGERSVRSEVDRILAKLARPSPQGCPAASRRW